MKNLFLALFCITIGLTSCTSSNKKAEENNKDSVTSTALPNADKQQLTELITRFVRAYISQDNQKANALIHPDLGIYIIYRPGAMDTYQHVDSLDFQRSIPEHFPYSTFENDYVLQFDSLPVFDCAEEKWNKYGFFCDTTVQADQLTQIASFKHEFKEINDRTLAEIKQVEKNTYRVILTKNENLIFHVKKYEGSWYIFVLDRAYGWCDA
ncbi:hypothetical protein [Sphingobacterium sp. LRF_L2]|uniref:hypothetical protein n=1 Tax=Sphingobacterium sp. LRF_L2 TaxID=3369421 RepID=UPI003F5F7D92